MTATDEAPGIVLVCESDGTIKEILRDDFQVAGDLSAGSNLNTLVDSGVREKIDAFLSEMRNSRSAYDWQITVPIQGRLTPLHFAGACIEEHYLIAASASQKGLDSLNEQVMPVDYAPTESSRTPAGEPCTSWGKPVEHDQAVYDELCRLNNEMTNLQREMAKKNAQLEQLNDQKNRLLGMAAHDLRSPLAAIRTLASFLEADAAAALNVEQREFVAIIKERSGFMLHLVTDLLDVAAIEAGHLSLDLQTTRLPQLIQANVAINRLLALPKNIAVDCERDDTAPSVRLDPGKIEQVLNNLIGNAIKFSARDTHVTVRLSHTPVEVTISIADEGPGIPRADWPKLFKPFSKLSARGTDGEPGAGLGLAIVRRIIEGHNGRIWIESEVGQGSTFFFTLPV